MRSLHYLHRSIRFRRTPSLVLVSLAGAALASCNSGPARVTQPYISAGAAGSAAMDEYDTNGDGAVSGDELEKAPGLKAALSNLDKDGDSQVTATEVTERVQAWQNQNTGLTNVRCLVIMDGRPLSGAEVVFEPESFLGGEIETAVGMADSSGTVSPVIPKDQRPTPQTPPGLRLGLYKVRISKIVGGKETVPARYNADTTLGQEVSADDPSMNQSQIVFKLQRG
jgi:hypothetical protein